MVINAVQSAIGSGGPYVPISGILYGVGFVLVASTLVSQRAAKHARALIVLGLYLLAGPDLALTVLGGAHENAEWILLIAFGTTLVMSTLVQRTRELLWFSAFQVTVLCVSHVGVGAASGVGLIIMASVVGVHFLVIGLAASRLQVEHARQAAEAQLIEARDAAEAASRAKSAFLAAMSHEIRTPLTAVIGYAEMLDFELRDAPGDLRELTHPIAEGGHRLLDTLDSVLTVARLEAGETAMRLGPVDISAEAETAVRLYRSAAEQAGLALRLTVPPAPALAHADRGAIARVLANLIGNAVKYTRIGHIEVSVDRHPEAVVVRVADSGIGIPPDVLPHVFEPFRQVTEGDHRDYEGVGLGLALVQKLVSSMGGSVEVRSEVGAGSTFEVCLATATAVSPAPTSWTPTPERPELAPAFAA